MVVKNEDQWVWFAIMSVLPHADKLLVTDTGSTDNTLAIIKSINSAKIILKQKNVTSPAAITTIRQQQIDDTTTDWIWIVDGDEIYPRATAQEVVKAVKTDKYEGIVVRRYDLLGDIYHRQIETVGEYKLFGQRGHLVTRLVNRQRIKGLHLKGNYPLEGFFDGVGKSTRDRDPRNWYITKSYLYHTMYLKRSSQGSNLSTVLNRSKYKIEKGIKLTNGLPEIFSQKRPKYVPNPLVKRSLGYEIAATLITPIKQLKRAIL